VSLTFSDAGENGHLIVSDKDEFDDARAYLADRLLGTVPQNQGKWQSLDISESSAHSTYELLNVTFWYQMPATVNGAQTHIMPDLPWAERHFQERVAGEAVNPGVEHANWPYHAGRVELHQNGGRYDHNYMERIWPTQLEHENVEHLSEPLGFRGYRFPVGDLDDVVTLLATDTGTRQAYLPIWFPEDTGSTEGQRVPCSLGYHFIIRDGVLHCQYNLRSCEIYRHFTNDIYMAVRLAQWVVEQLSEVHGLEDLRLGQLTTHIVSLHGFVGDKHNIEGLLT
jgi:thymidylate synthase